MPYYDGCRIFIKVPTGYSQKEKLTSFFESEHEGCSIIFEEDASVWEPDIDRVFVPKGSPASGALASPGWTPVISPTSSAAPPMEDVSGKLLLRSAIETLQKFRGLN
jgi:hypothetical protein